MQIPLGMIVTSVRSFNDGTAELFGFWYFKEMYVPSTVLERKKIFSDLLSGRCKQLKVTGRLQQIYDLLIQTDRFDAGDSNAEKMYINLVTKLEDTPNTNIAFDDVMSPQGTGLTLDTACEFDETVASIRNKIFAETDYIHLEISKDYNFLDNL